MKNMEPKSKVYINPNFKRIQQTCTGLSEESKTTYINKYFPHKLKTKQMHQQQDDANGRKIYVNPNFKPVNNTCHGQVPYTSDHNIRNYNSTIHLNQKVTNTHCFVNEVKPSLNYEMLQIKNPMYSYANYFKKSDTNCYTNQNHTDPKVVVQPVNNYLQTPLSKSRYCIVRKNNVVSTSKFSLNSNIQVIPQSKVHILTNTPTGSSTSNKNIVPINQKPKMCNITPQKVTKIKISKYKTIPLSYLKTNSQNAVTNKVNPSYPATQPYNKVPAKNGRLNSFLLATYSKNRFKFVKSKSLLTSEFRPVIKTNTLKLRRPLSLHKSKINIKAKFKINNIPCRLFSKYGKCLREDYGKCDYLHDKKHVSLCRKFLKGICHDQHCTLSHELSAKKMPTCYFYLKGMCTKEHCPYVHIKLSEKTKICQDFVKGYCEKGDACPLRHVKNQEIKNTKHCKLNISSRNQKRVIKNKNMQIKLNHKKVYRKNENETRVQEKSEIDCRYYDDGVKNDSSCEIIKPSRCKLGTLPSFIQL